MSGWIAKARAARHHPVVGMQVPPPAAADKNRHAQQPFCAWEDMLAEATWCDIAVMNNGQVEQYATPQEIYDRPATPFVAEFVGQGNWLPFQRRGDSLAQVGGMNMRLAPNAGNASSGRLFCRPEAITVNPVVHEENLFPAKVREITFLGNRCRMSFELKALPGHALLAELAPEAMPRLGSQDIWVALPPQSLQVFA